MIEYTLAELAEKLGLTLKGESIPIRGLNTLEAAEPNELSFLANPKYAHFLESTQAGAIIVDEAHANQVKRALISKNPYQDFGRALALFARKEGVFSGISDLAYIHPEAKLGKDCTVYPFAYIGSRVKTGDNCTFFPGVYVGEDCTLGHSCILYPNAVLLSKVTLGNSCVLQPSAVIGAEGFGFTRVPNGIQKIPQAGYVMLGDEVEVGANSAIDRGALGPTLVGKQTKIDNLVQVGHNVTVGEENLLVAQVGIAGSTKTGKRVTMAGQAGISGHLHIGDNAIIGPQAGVAQDVPENFNGSGTPLVDGQTFLRSQLILKKLPEFYKRFNKMEKELNELKKYFDDKEQA